MILEYSDKSLKDLKGFSQPDRTLIVKKLHYLKDNFDLLRESKKVTALKGCEFDNQYRFVVAKKIRVLFSVKNEKIILLVLRVGLRKSIYKN